MTFTYLLERIFKLEDTKDISGMVTDAHYMENNLIEHFSYLASRFILYNRLGRENLM